MGEQEDRLAAQEAVNALRAGNKDFAEFYRDAQEAQLGNEEILEQWAEWEAANAPAQKDDEDTQEDDGGAQ